MERADGFQGPIVISDPESEDEKQLKEMYDEEATVFLQDWYHLNGNMRRTGLDTSPFIWIGNAQTFLINGGGVFSPCLGYQQMVCPALMIVLLITTSNTSKLNWERPIYYA